MISPKKAVWVGTFLICFTIIEFINKPINFSNSFPEETKFYTALNRLNNIQVIVELPISNQARITENGIWSYNPNDHYMLWASTMHSKTLLNGNSGFLPKEYLKKTSLLSQNFPTEQKIKLLKKWGVDAIVLNKKEYTNSGDFKFTKSRLEDLGLKRRLQTPNLILYDITKSN